MSGPRVNSVFSIKVARFTTIGIKFCYKNLESALNFWLFDASPIIMFSSNIGFKYILCFYKSNVLGVSCKCFLGIHYIAKFPYIIDQTELFVTVTPQESSIVPFMQSKINDPQWHKTDWCWTSFIITQTNSKHVSVFSVCCYQFKMTLLIQPCVITGPC